MEQPLVSIVVVSYNHSKYIRENLDSIKAQTYKNIELIVADDASSDNSVEVYEQWLKENEYSAKKNFHTKNTGLSTTLNECIEIVTGKYVKLLAADDYLHPEYLINSVTKLEELGKEYGMVFTNIFTVDDNSTLLADYADYDALGLVDKELFRKEQKKINRIAALSVLMRADVLRETGPYDENLLIEDYYKWLQINDKYYIGYIPKKLCYYRLHSNNISKTKAQQITDETLILNIKFDSDGSSSKYINDSVISSFYKGSITKNENLKNSYFNYPFRNKLLSFFIKNNLPFLPFRILNKLI